MDKKLKLILISLSSAISMILVVSFAFAWTNPSSNPPGGGGVLYYSGGNVGISDSSPASLFVVGSGDLFQVNSSGDLIRIRNITYSWPSSQGAANTALINNGAGTLSWSPVVNQIVAGSNITISPSGGTGIVTINSTGGGAVSNVSGSGGVTASPTTGNVGVSLTYPSKSCSSGQAIQSFNLSSGSSPGCVTVSGSGVTGVYGSSGVWVSPSTGSVTVGLNYPNYNCGSNAISYLALGTGGVSCVSVGGGGSGVSGSGSANYIPMWTGTTSLGSSGISHYPGSFTNFGFSMVIARGVSSSVSSGQGVYGSTSNGAGVQGQGGTYGVAGFGTYGVYGSGIYGVFGQGNPYGGYFNGNVQVNGSVSYTGGAYNNSDIKFKKDIQPIQFSVLDKISGLQGVSFNWKKEEFPDKRFLDGKRYGFIAQEVEKIIPEIVQTNPEGEKSVSYEELTPFLVEAVKEQQAQINSLKSEIEILKTK